MCNPSPAAQYNNNQGGHTPKYTESPLKIAATWLGKRFIERPAGFFLDGVPVNLKTVMRETVAVMNHCGGVVPKEWPEGWRH